MDKKMPKPVDGGVVTQGGLAIVHAGEPIIPLETFREMFGDVEPGNHTINIKINPISEEELLALSDKIKQSIIDAYRKMDVPRNYRPS